MAYQLQFVLFCASMLMVSVSGRPQVWDIGFNPRLPPQDPTLTEAAQVVADPSSTTPPTPRVQTTPSPQYYECLSRCPTTSEYNPICGSDSVNYPNMGRLNCAIRCGTAVTMVRAGTCTPSG